MRILAGEATKVQARHVDADGNLANVTGTVTATVRNGAGAQIANGNAAAAGTGIYEFTVPAQTTLDRLAVTFTNGSTWTRVVYADVVGTRLFELDELKAMPGMGSLGGATLRRLRDEVEERFTDMLGYPVVPQSLRTTQLAGGSRLLVPDLLYPLELYTVTDDSGALDVSKLTERNGWIEWADGAGAWVFARPVSIHARHGLEDPPSDLRQAGLRYARYLAKDPDSKIPERATRVITSDADLQLQTPDADHPTGLPDVDAVLLRHRIQLPV